MSGCGIPANWASRLAEYVARNECVKITASLRGHLSARTVAQIDVFRSDVRDEIENIFFLSPLCGGSGVRGGGGTCQQAVKVGSELHDSVSLTLRTTAVPRLTVDANYSFLHREVSGTPGDFQPGRRRTRRSGPRPRGCRTARLRSFQHSTRAALSR